MPKLQHVSLFAGVGGLDLAAHEAEIPTLLACELDDAARGVLADRFPSTILHADVRELTADDLRAAGADPRRTVLSAGWPCQGNSVAGDRQGMADPRSGLWSQVARLLAEFRPAWFVGENVDGLLSVNDGRDFGAVVGDLAELGYGYAWRVLDAQYFGVPQRRRRVVIVGRAGGDGAAPVEVLLEPESGQGHPAARQQAGSGTARAARGRIAATLTAGTSRPGVSAPGRRQEDDANLVVAVAGSRTHALTAEGSDASEDGTGRGTPIITVNALTATQGGPDDNDAQAGHLLSFELTQDPISGDVVPAMGAKSTGQGIQTPSGVRRLTPLECERLQGWPDNHTATSNGRVQSDTARYHQCGNGVATPVFSWVFQKLVESDRSAA